MVGAIAPTAGRCDWCETNRGECRWLINAPDKASGVARDKSDVRQPSIHVATNGDPADTGRTQTKTPDPGLPSREPFPCERLLPDDRNQTEVP